MKDLMLILSDAMPEDMIIEQIEGAIKKYKENPCKDTRSFLAMTCLMFTSKEAIDQTKGGLDAVLEKADKFQKGYQILDIDNKQS